MKFNMNRIKKLFVLAALFVICGVVFVFTDYAVSNNTRFNFQLDKTKTEMENSMSGLWSGKHISLEITEQGAKVEYDCAHGNINKKIILDKRNHFDVLGTYIEEHGGPVKLNNASGDFPVRYIGQIKGEKMTLTVKRKDNNKVIGTFSLVHNQESSLVKCR
jgi:hypothetical protein